MTREQRFLFKIASLDKTAAPYGANRSASAAIRRGGAFAGKSATLNSGGRSFGSGYGFGSTGSRIQSPGANQRTASGSTSWGARSAQAQALANRTPYMRQQKDAAIARAATTPMQTARLGADGKLDTSGGGLINFTNPNNQKGKGPAVSQYRDASGNVKARSINWANYNDAMRDPNLSAANKQKLQQHALSTKQQFASRAIARNPELRGATPQQVEANNSRSDLDIYQTAKMKDPSLKYRVSGTTGSQGQFNNANWNPGQQARNAASQYATVRDTTRRQYTYGPPDNIKNQQEYDNWKAQNNQAAAAWGGQLNALQAPSVMPANASGFDRYFNGAYTELYNRRLSDLYGNDYDRQFENTLRDAYGQPQQLQLNSTPLQQQQARNQWIMRRRAAGLPELGQPQVM